MQFSGNECSGPNIHLIPIIFTLCLLVACRIPIAQYTLYFTTRSTTKHEAANSYVAMFYSFLANGKMMDAYISYILLFSYKAIVTLKNIPRKISITALLKYPRSSIVCSGSSFSIIMNRRIRFSSYSDPNTARNRIIRLSISFV